MWTTRPVPDVTLSPDALMSLGAAHGVRAWPTVLDLPAPDAVVGELADEVLARAGATGFVDDRLEPTSWASSTLAVLGMPERQIEVRIPDDSQPRCACLLRRGFDHVLVVRSGDRVELSTPVVADIDDVGRVVGSMFAPAAVPEFVGISVPAAELRERLDRCACADDYAASFAAVGATRVDAATMSRAFQSCRARAEVVATTTIDGVTTPSSGRVAVYETDHGRIIAGPSISPDGRMWTTISPGSDDRLGHAVTQLLDTLPGSGWLP